MYPISNQDKASDSNQVHNFRSCDWIGTFILEDKFRNVFFKVLQSENDNPSSAVRQFEHSLTLTVCCQIVLHA